MRLKIDATIQNAKAFADIVAELGSFDRYLWSFVDGRPRQNGRKSLKDVPPKSPESDAMSKDLKRRGFKFVGSTICYALMQATGMMNDHLIGCHRYDEIRQANGG